MAVNPNNAFFRVPNIVIDRTKLPLYTTVANFITERENRNTTSVYLKCPPWLGALALFSVLPSTQWKREISYWLRRLRTSNRYKQMEIKHSVTNVLHRQEWGKRVMMSLIEYGYRKYKSEGRRHTRCEVKFWKKVSPEGYPIGLSVIAPRQRFSMRDIRKEVLRRLRPTWGSRGGNVRR